MGCITSANFVVLVNGDPTIFFKASRGLRQGCPLSPLLFLLIVEGLSRIIYKEKNEKNLKGIKITRILSITHLLFEVDVVFFGNGSMEEWIAYKKILTLLYNVIGMAIGESKSMFLEFGIIPEVKDHIYSLFSFKFLNLE